MRNNNTEVSKPESEEVKPRLTREKLLNTYRIFRYIRPYKTRFSIGLVFLFFSSATALVFPYVTGQLVDAATGETVNWLGDINAITLGLVAILILQAAFSYARIMLFAVVSERSMADIRKDLFSRLIHLPMPFFEERRVGELTSRLTADVTQLQDSLSITLAEFFRQITILLVGVVIIFLKSPLLTLVMLSTFPVLVLMAIWLGRFIRKLSKETQDALAGANVVVEESLQNIQVVKAFTSELFETLRYATSIDMVVHLALKASRYRALFVSFIIFSLFGGIVLVLWVGAGQVSKGAMTIGDLTAFIIYTLFIGGSVGGMGDLYSKLQKTVGATERINEILEEIPETGHTGLKSSEQGTRLQGAIDFDKVQFSYPSRPDVPVLKDISFHLSPGKKVALVGPSGAGKSTIIQLLLGFHEPGSGSIYFDNKEQKNWSQIFLRKNIGIVPQEVLLFGGTIRENIAYARPDATDSEILEAAKKANALDFIQAFPDGMETLVGERGIKLSGGQKQRIAIARAILKDPAILLLDEATSSLDAESEQLVQQALETLMANRTTLIIAHRLATIRQVDEILALSHGKIVEQGSHEELLEKPDGYYRKLISLQFEFQS